MVVRNPTAYSNSRRLKTQLASEATDALAVLPGIYSLVLRP